MNDITISNQSTGFDNILYINLAKTGDKFAFSSLIDYHRQALYRVAIGILKSEYDAADAIQEAIVVAYKNIGSLRNESFFKTWIIRILINECKKVLKNNAKTVSTEDLADKTIQDVYPSDNATSEYINLLEPKLKYVTVLYYYEDFSIKEIAQILSIPQGTVKSRLQRARGKLLKMITGKGDIKNEE